MKRILFFAAIVAICFVSCNSDEVFTENDNGRRTTSGIELLNEVFSADRKAEMLNPFARALYNAMSESPMLRELIRTRALERFNREYDVLYQLIKNEQVENGLTVRQLLLTHFESEEALAYIERNRPTLTIFVPRLPEGSFSAQLWNTDKEVPFVALHVTRHIYTPIIGDFGEYGNEFLIKDGYTPAFPVVVLRDNARVRVAESSPRTRSAALDNPNSDFVFEFTDPYFDGSKADKSISTRQATTNVLDATVQRAFQIFPNDAAGWQRDYIYYGITPTNPDGRLSRNFKEHITSFRFCDFRHTPEQILRNLTQYDRDPRLRDTAVLHYWTIGSYTFMINVQVGATAPHLSQLARFFIVYPDELFEVTRTRIPGIMPRYNARVTGFRTVGLKTPLMNWNLGQFEPTMRISIAKQNPGLTLTTTTSHEAEFARNVNLDSKSGMRFGTTTERDRRTVSVQRVYRLENKELGCVFVDFGDVIVLGQQGNTWRLREHSNGMFIITVQPKRVQ